MKFKIKCHFDSSQNLKLKMDVANLNSVIEHLKKVNEEVLQNKIKSDMDLLAFNELKTKYLEKSKELDEANAEINELKRFVRQLKYKLSGFLTTKIENKKLRIAVRKLKRKLNSNRVCKELDLIKLEDKIGDDKISYDKIGYDKIGYGKIDYDKNDYDKIDYDKIGDDKIAELQRILSEKEKDYQESLNRIRNETKNSLLTLEAKIRNKIKMENQKFNNLGKLNDNDRLIEALNVSNLRLKEKLALKEEQYLELENNYLRLKVKSERCLLKNESGDFESCKTKRSNIEDVLREVNEINKSCFQELFNELESFEISDEEYESDSSDGTLNRRRLQDGHTLQLDFKQNEISVEVKSCGRSTN